MRPTLALAYVLFRYGRVISRVATGLDNRALEEIRSILDKLVAKGYLIRPFAEKVWRIILKANELLKRGEVFEIDEAIERAERWWE